MKKILIFMLLTLFVTNILAEVKSGRIKKNVVVLHSYHQGQLWTNSEIKGIFSVFDEKWETVDVFVEYMDTKRFLDKPHLSNLKNYFETKYKQKKIDILIAADDNALKFASNFRTVFKNAPIVFCGVNNYKNYELTNQNITGIIEKIGFAENIDLATKINPNLKYLYIINDQTPTGIANEKVLKSYLASTEATKYENLNFIFLDYMSMEALTSKIKNLPEEGMILLLTYTRDADGKVFNFRDAGSKIANATNIPVISCWDFYLGYGIIGGYITSGFEQGKEAAKMAMQILNGAKTSGIAINKTSNNKYLFDYQQLQKFGINIDGMFKKAEVINEKITFWQKNKKSIIAFVLFSILLMVALVVLVVSLAIRRKALKQMAKSKIFLKNVLDSMPSLLITLDASGRISNCNAKFEKFVKKTESELKGLYLTDVFIEKNWEDFAAKVIASIKKQKITNQKNLKIVYEEKEYIFEVTVFPLEFNSVENTVVRIDDVTSNAKIQEMMVETEKMISIGGLAGGIAHEINNPLGGIIQGIQNVTRRLDPNFSKNLKVAEEIGVDYDLVNKYLNERQVNKFLASIHESGVRAAEIIKNMLSFAQKKSSHVTVDKPAEIMEKALELAKSDYSIRKNVEFSNIKVVKEYAPFAKPLKCNKIEIEQVLLNIIKNSAEALAEQPPRKPTISLKVIQEENELIYEIQDNGPGIPEEIKEHIFEPFFSTKTYKTGNGIGLAVCYYIVTNNHNGKIIVDSEFGTKFKIVLPNNY